MARRRFTRRRNNYRRPRSGGMFDLSKETLAGLGVGWTDMDKHIPKDLVVLGATAPVNGFNQGKRFFRGVIFGNRMKSLLSGGQLNQSGFGGV